MSLSPSRREFIQAVFAEAPFVRELGVELVGVDSGFCETRLRIEPRHGQQNGFVHAGVSATLADHTAGGAAASSAPDGFGVLSIEFKISMLRPAMGESLRCVAKTIRAGKSISFVESEVFSLKDGVEALVAKASVTLAIVAWKPTATPP